MKSQSQRVPIISLLEKNYELLENRGEPDFTTDVKSSLADLTPAATNFSPRNSVKIADKFDMKSTNDDMSPESLVNEGGALSPSENGLGETYDQHFTIVSERDIDREEGLDTATLADLNPLDGKPESQARDQHDDSQQTLIFYPFPSTSDQK